MNGITWIHVAGGMFALLSGGVRVDALTARACPVFQEQPAEAVG
jgi:hypothetical protein